MDDNRGFTHFPVTSEDESLSSEISEIDFMDDYEVQEEKSFINYPALKPLNSNYTPQFEYDGSYWDSKRHNDYEDLDQRDGYFSQEEEYSNQQDEESIHRGVNFSSHLNSNHTNSQSNFQYNPNARETSGNNEDIFEANALRNGSKRAPIYSSRQSESSLSSFSTPEPIYGKLSRVEGGCVGLRNLGNTCYLNSALQCLTGVEELTFKLAEDLEKGRFSGRDCDFVQVAAKLFHEMWEAGGKTSSLGRSVAPNQFKSFLGHLDSRFFGYGQEDSQEALSLILDKLHEGLKSTGEDEDENKTESHDGWDQYCRKENSIVRELFHGQLRSTITCSKCSRKSESFEPFSFLNLPIPTNEAQNIAKPKCLPEKKGFRMLCYNEYYFNSESAYLIVEREFHSEIDFRSRFRGRGLWIVGLNGNGSEISIDKNVPSAEDRADRERSFIAYAANLMEKSFLISFVSEESKDPLGFPILVSTLPFHQEFTLEDLVNVFLGETVLKIVKLRFPEKLDAFKAALEMVKANPSNFFTIERSIPAKYDLTHVVIGIKSEEVNSQIFGNIDGFFEDLTRMLPAESGSEDVSDSEAILKLTPEIEQNVTLKDCFDRLFTIEELSVEDNWKCEGCKVAVSAEKRLELWRTPPILVLHLKRFSYGHNGSHYGSLYGYRYASMSSGTKLSKAIDFPIELDISEILKGIDGTIYDLFAICQHFGNLNFGHYTAIVKHNNTGKWFQADDGSINFLQDNVSAWLNDRVKGSAYVLFYRKRQEQ